MHRRGDVGARERQPVVGRDARRLRREPGTVQRGEEPVTRAVAGEHAPGPVGPVRRRRQPDDDEPRAADRRSRARRVPSRSGPRTTPGPCAPPLRARRPAAGSAGRPPPPAAPRPRSPSPSAHGWTPRRRAYDGHSCPHRFDPPPHAPRPAGAASRPRRPPCCWCGTARRPPPARCCRARPAGSTSRRRAWPRPRPRPGASPR